MLQNRLVTTMEYQADNKSTRDKTLIIEHPFTQGWKLIAPEQPLETTRTLYRFRGLAAAGKVTTLTVTEERVQWQSLTMLSANLPQLISYSTRGELEPAVREAVIRAIQMRQGIIDLEKQVADRAEQLSAIAQEQERIRENMRTVGQSTQYYERLLAKLNQQESQIELLQRERESLQQQLETQRTALADYLGGLTIGG
jgi:DNA repair exonuclease SbcCD ATPase subunit